MTSVITTPTLPGGGPIPQELLDLMDQPFELDGPAKPVELTPQQKKLWGDTMSYMAWTAPGYRHIFYKLLCNNDGEYMAVFTRDVPIAATDGANIYLNPDTFFPFGLKERVFVLLHEIQHNVYDDIRTMHRLMQQGTVPRVNTKGAPLPYDNDWYQQAMDHRINSLLISSKMGKMPHRDGEQVGIYDPKICADGMKGAWEIYEQIYKKRPKGKGPGGGKGNGPGGFDVVLKPGSGTPKGKAPQRNPGQWQVVMEQARKLENDRAQGKMPGAMQRMFQEILEPEVPWTEHIRTEMARKVGAGSYDWRRPDRRFIVRDIHLPGRSGFGAGWIVLWGDTSGSMGRDELERCLAEVSGIVEDVRPKRLTILWGDAKLCHVDEVEDASDLQTIKARGVGGGGGTRVMLAFDWLAEQLDVPDMFLGFTDGYCEPFPKNEPAFPVIWASTTDKKYPWGEVVRINKIGQQQ